jgi:putative ABC transport system permease protein
MQWLRRVIAGAKALARRERAERELDEELGSYLEAAVEEMMRSGMSREEATRTARIGTGLVSADSVKGSVRDVGWETRVDTLWQDLCYARRTLRRSPGFASVTVVTLALGIGATVAIFTALEGVLLRSLPYDHPERIVRVWESSPERGLQRFEVLPGSFLDWRERSTVFESLALYRTTLSLVTARGTTERLQTTFGSPALFEVFGVFPALGRGFVAEEGRPTGSRDPEEYAGHPEVVISHRLWEREFASDPAVIGERVTFNGVSDLTIVGVMRPGFEFPAGTEIWGEELLTRGIGRGDRWRDAIGRLKAGVSIEQARAELRTIAQQSAIAHPKTNTGWTVTVETLTKVIVGDVRPALLALFAAVACLLLIACANVASVALARSTTRRHELAVRLALGATRGRLVRSSLAEGLLTTCVAGVLGVLLASVLLDLALAWAPPEVPRLQEVGINLRILGFALGLSILTSFVFTLAPWQLFKRQDVENGLKSGATRLAAPGRARTGAALLAAQVALSLALLFGAGLLIQSFLQLRSRDLGMDPSNVWATELAVPLGRFAPPGGLRVGGRPEWQRLAALYPDILGQIRTLPGVESSALVSVPPASNETPGFFRHVGNTTAQPDPDRWPAVTQVITPEYFEVLRVPLRRGRGFTHFDRATEGRLTGTGPGAPGVAIVNETMAKRYWPGRDPIGQQIVLEGDDWVTSRTIVAVAADVLRSPTAVDIQPVVYVPLAERRPPLAMTLLLRADTKGNFVPGLPAMLRARDSTLSVSAIRPLKSVLGQSLAEHRFATVLVFGFGVLALFITATGMYGVVAFIVSQRTREIGVRVALGARHENVLAMVAQYAARPVIGGVLMGLVAAFWVSRIVAAFVSADRTVDSLVLAATVAVILIVAVLAVIVPARTALAVDPVRTLRSE